MTNQIIPTWENRLQQMIKDNVDEIVSHLPNDYTFIDIGSNTGLLTKMVTELKPDYKVIHMFEPVRRYYTECVNKFGNISNIHINSFGLGHKVDSVKIKLDGHNLGYNQISEDGNEVIHLSTFDLYSQLYNITEVDFIKTDTEGWDINVMYGMERFLTNTTKLPFIYFEKGWNLDVEKRHCEYMAQRYGYKEVRIFEYDYLLIP